MGVTYEPKEGLMLGFLVKNSNPSETQEALDIKQLTLSDLPDRRLFELALNMYDSPLLNLERISSASLLEELKISEEKYQTAETAGKLASMSKLIYAKQSGIFLLELKTRCPRSFEKTLADAGIGKTQCEIKMRIAKRWTELVPLAFEAIDRGEICLSLAWADKILRKKSIKSGEPDSGDNEKLDARILSRTTNYLKQKPEIISQLPDESIARIAIAIGRRYQNPSLIDFGTSLLDVPQIEPKSA
ncbi:MAG: hypothetical protein MUE44_13855 [Oscillatoriaceae cyanobacterium Prado104]|jgi:hypothetical protein|nr:hypothetical protein [Oscillatoriaceae cyanobacterium Prado104]